MIESATKKLDDLTLDDLERVMVWRVDDVGGLEIAKPLAVTDIRFDGDVMMISRTRFRFANGHVHIGWSTPGDWGAGDHLLPVIIHHGRPLPPADAAGGLDLHWGPLAPSLDQIFPVTATADATVSGRTAQRRYNADGTDPDAPTGKGESIWSKLSALFGTERY